ncbi:MAG: hypothetical protein LBJ09_00620 [Clostridiales bacterium]|jgi:hypothetical protein|nr:hypothetical protein [Clostridiales bacterium]
MLLNNNYKVYIRFSADGAGLSSDFFSDEQRGVIDNLFKNVILNNFFEVFYRVNEIKGNGVVFARQILDYLEGRSSEIKKIKFTLDGVEILGFYCDSKIFSADFKLLYEFDHEDEFFKKYGSDERVKIDGCGRPLYIPRNENFDDIIAMQLSYDFKDQNLPIIRNLINELELNYLDLKTSLESLYSYIKFSPSSCANNFKQMKKTLVDEDTLNFLRGNNCLVSFFCEYLGDRFKSEFFNALKKIEKNEDDGLEIFNTYRILINGELKTVYIWGESLFDAESGTRLCGFDFSYKKAFDDYGNFVELKDVLGEALDLSNLNDGTSECYHLNRSIFLPVHKLNYNLGIFKEFFNLFRRNNVEYSFSIISQELFGFNLSEKFEKFKFIINSDALSNRALGNKSFGVYDSYFIKEFSKLLSFPFFDCILENIVSNNTNIGSKHNALFFILKDIFERNYIDLFYFTKIVINNSEFSVYRIGNDLFDIKTLKLVASFNPDSDKFLDSSLNEIKVYVKDEDEDENKVLEVLTLEDLVFNSDCYKLPDFLHPFQYLNLSTLEILKSFHDYAVSNLSSMSNEMFEKVSLRLSDIEEVNVFNAHEKKLLSEIVKSDYWAFLHGIFTNISEDTTIDNFIYSISHNVLFLEYSANVNGSDCTIHIDKKHGIVYDKDFKPLFYVNESGNFINFFGEEITLIINEEEIKDLNNINMNQPSDREISPLVLSLLADRSILERLLVLFKERGDVAYDEFQDFMNNEIIESKRILVEDEFFDIMVREIDGLSFKKAFTKDQRDILEACKSDPFVLKILPLLQGLENVEEFEETCSYFLNDRSFNGFEVEISGVKTEVVVFDNEIYSAVSGETLGRIVGNVIMSEGHPDVVLNATKLDGNSLLIEIEGDYVFDIENLDPAEGNPAVFENLKKLLGFSGSAQEAFYELFKKEEDIDGSTLERMQNALRKDVPGVEWNDGDAEDDDVEVKHTDDEHADDDVKHSKHTDIVGDSHVIAAHIPKVVKNELESDPVFPLSSNLPKPNDETKSVETFELCDKRKEEIFKMRSKAFIQKDFETRRSILLSLYQTLGLNHDQETLFKKIFFCYTVDLFAKNGIFSTEDKEKIEDIFKNNPKAQTDLFELFENGNEKDFLEYFKNYKRFSSGLIGNLKQLFVIVLNGFLDIFGYKKNQRTVEAVQKTFCETCDSDLCFLFNKPVLLNERVSTCLFVNADEIEKHRELEILAKFPKETKDRSDVLPKI